MSASAWRPILVLCILVLASPLPGCGGCKCTPSGKSEKSEKTAKSEKSETETGGTTVIYSETCALAPAEDAVEHPLTVVRYADLTRDPDDDEYQGEVLLSNAEVDQTFRCMAQLLEKDHDGGGTEDVSCVVRFVRNGDVGTFENSSDGYIYTRKDFNEVMAMPGCIKMLKGIYYCGGMRKAETCPLSSTAWGCGQIPTVGFTSNGAMTLTGGRKFAVRRKQIVDDVWAQLWAHEFGHTQGLTDDSGNSTMLMHKVISGFSTNVPQTHADKYRIARDLEHCDATPLETDNSDSPASCASSGGG